MPQKKKKMRHIAAKNAIATQIKKKNFASQRNANKKTGIVLKTIPVKFIRPIDA